MSMQSNSSKIPEHTKWVTTVTSLLVTAVAGLINFISPNSNLVRYFEIASVAVLFVICIYLFNLRSRTSDRG
jgi:heme A synthase